MIKNDNSSVKTSDKQSEISIKDPASAIKILKDS